MEIPKDDINAMIETTKKEFIEGCYEAYDLLASKGKSAIENTDVNAIESAINRMTALFILREDYERCQFLKKYVELHLPGIDIKPDMNVQKELSL
jgi:hypothetical protein